MVRYMSKLLLITRPNYEITTRYLFAWSGQIVDLAKTKGIDVIELKKNKANRKEFESRLAKLKPQLVIINGHGSDTCVTGHDGEVLIEAGQNEDILYSKIVYSLSCNSASCLGIESVKAGALCYIGYKTKFTFFHRNKITHPLEDNIAKLFLDPSNQVAVSLLKGNKTQEANRKSKELSIRNIQKLLNSASSKESVLYARFLWSNMYNQVCHGNQNACF